MEKTKSLFEIREDFVIDLSQIVWMVKKGAYSWVRCNSVALDIPDQEFDDLLKAWIAYKGKFDPSKER